MRPWRDSAFLTVCSFPHSHLITAGGDLRRATNETHRKSNACRTKTQLPVCPCGSAASIWLHLGHSSTPSHLPSMVRVPLEGQPSD